MYASLGPPMGGGGKGSTGSDPAGDTRGHGGGRQHGRAAAAADRQPPTTGTSTRQVSQSDGPRQCGRSRPTPSGVGVDAENPRAERGREDRTMADVRRGGSD